MLVGREVGCGVDGDAAGQQVHVDTLLREACHHPHLVLGERSGLVGADHGGGAHGLAGVELAHEVVLLQHLAHAQGQAHRNAHGQSFGHGHHDEGHGNHDGVDQHLEEA